MKKIIIFLFVSSIFCNNVDSLNFLNESNDAWKMNMLMLGGGILPMGQLENNKPYKAISIFGLNYYWLKEFKKAKIADDISDRNRSFWWMFFLTTYSVIDAYVDSHMNKFPDEKNITK
tara:strand:+ start:305 stop:658 length:354 start_codon:yes stop_codon:yes gene_type:complete